MLVYQSGAVFLTQHQLNINSTDLLNNGRKNIFVNFRSSPKSEIALRLAFPAWLKRVFYFFGSFCHTKNICFSRKKRPRVTTKYKHYKSEILLPKYACGAGAGAFPAGLHKRFNMYCKHLLSAVKHICCNLPVSLMLSVTRILGSCLCVHLHSTIQHSSKMYDVCKCL